jgi:hypothetical protein
MILATECSCSSAYPHRWVPVTADTISSGHNTKFSLEMRILDTYPRWVIKLAALILGGSTADFPDFSLGLPNA